MNHGGYAGESVATVSSPAVCVCIVVGVHELAGSFDALGDVPPPQLVLGPGAELLVTGALVGAPPPFELEAQPAATSAVAPSRTVRTARCRMITSRNASARESIEQW